MHTSARMTKTLNPFRRRHQPPQRPRHGQGRHPRHRPQKLGPQTRAHQPTIYDQSFGGY